MNGFTLAAAMFGGSKGALDVSANAQAVVAERAGERPLVSACHGFWSLGLLCGSSLTALALKFRVAPPAATLLAGFLLLGLSLVATGFLHNEVPVDTDQEPEATIWPRAADVARDPGLLRSLLRGGDGRLGRVTLRVRSVCRPLRRRLGTPSMRWR